MKKYIVLCLCVVSVYAQEYEQLKEQVEKFEKEEKHLSELKKRSAEKEREIRLIETARKKKEELERTLEKVSAESARKETKEKIAQQEKIIEKGEQLKIEQKKTAEEMKVATGRLAGIQAGLAKSIKSFERDIYTPEETKSLIERIRKDMYTFNYDSTLWKKQREVILDKGFAGYSGKDMEDFVYAFDELIKTRVSLDVALSRHMTQSQRSIFAKLFEYFCLRIKSLAQGEPFDKLQQELIDFKSLKEESALIKTILRAEEMVSYYGSEHMQRVLAADTAEVDRLRKLLSKTPEDIDPIRHDRYTKELEKARVSVEKSLKLRKYALLEEVNYVAYTVGSTGERLTPLAQAILVLSVEPRNKAALAYVSSLKMSGPELYDIIPLSASADEAVGQLLSVGVGDTEQVIKDLKKQVTPALVAQFQQAKSKADKVAGK